MTVPTGNSFSSDSISDRIGDLLKKVNVSRFAEEHGLARKTLYKMRDNGVMPRNLLWLLCEEAGVSPILVEYSASERLLYFSYLSDYVRSSTVEDIYSEYLIEAEKVNDSTLFSSLNLVHQMMVDGDISPQKYDLRIKELLKETKPVK